MYRVLTASQAREVEERAVSEQGISLAALMSAAGAAVAEEICARVPSGDLVVLAGGGNNGGDGWVAARRVHASGRSVVLLTAADPADLRGIAAEAAADAIAAGVAYQVHHGPLPEAALADAAGIVDALLGIGASGGLREPLASWVEDANATAAYILAVDVPTGVDADTGALPGPAIRADCTVTFTTPKRGLVTFPAAAFAGEIVVADIGIDRGIAVGVLAPQVWTSREYADLVPLPAPDSHKDSRGRVLVIAGSGAFPGAAVLATRGAMRAGAGYVTLAVPESIVGIAQGHLIGAPVVGFPEGRTHAFSSSAAPAILRLVREYDAVVLGPGLTLADGAVAAARAIVAGAEVPLVIDADALNALVDATQLITDRIAPTVLTPHPGELGRLLGIETSAVQADRLDAGARLAGENCAVVLKGAATVISCADRQVINTSGTPALATAGTGDVLAGMIGAFLAQGLEPLSAGALGAYVHGRAGQAAAEDLTPVSVISEDIPEYFSAAFAELLGVW